MRINLFLLSAALIALMVSGACGGTEIKFIETRYGEDKPATKKILVAYASKAGSTAEVADFIGKSLAGKGAVVDVKQIKSLRDISGYQAVVIGSAIRAGELLPETVDFAKLHKENLQRIPVAYFVVCTTLRINTEERRKKVNAYLDPLCAEITPVDKGLFAGKMDYSKLDFISKIIIKYMVKTPEGDFRDWDAVKKWVDNLFPKLIQAKI